MTAKRTLIEWLSTDRAGLALVVGGGVWSVLTTAIQGGDQGAVVGFYVTCIAAFVVARTLTRIDLAVVPLAVVCIGVVIIAVASPGEIFNARPLAGPWGYSAITGAFYLQCAFAAGLLAVDRRPWLRPIGLLALVFAAITVATHTRSATAMVALVPLVFVVRKVAGTRAAITACWGVALVVVAVTAVLAATYAPGERTSPIDRLVDKTLSERRVERQHDAWEMMMEHPLLGVGGGRYRELSASVAKDADSPYAHHDFLQHGAEAGILGMLLTLAIASWGFLRLRRSVVSRNRSALVALSLASVVIHACTEQILERPAIPALAAALVGCALRSPGRRAS